MKSKLTLRLDDEVKQRAKKLAAERGTSLSQLVEDYFRLLSGEKEQLNTAGGDAGDLPPHTRALRDRLGQPAPPVDVDEDTRAWIDAAAEKHA